MAINQQQIINAIIDIIFKDGTKLVDIISNIVIKDFNIGFSIDIFGKDLYEAEEIKIRAMQQLNTIPDIKKITIILTSSKDVIKKPGGAKVKYPIEGVKKIILIASGKGGVGKSTVAALIAEQLNLF